MSPYWTRTAEEIARSLGVGLTGLTSQQAQERLLTIGPNEITARPRATRLRVLWRQVRSPLIVLLIFAAAASTASGQWLDACIVAAILGASVGVGYVREYRAEMAIGQLLARVQPTAKVLRDGRPCVIPRREVVPGDVVLLSAGSVVPADAVLITAHDLYVDDAALTGESFPVRKRVGPAPADAPVRERRGIVYFGTNVRSGTGQALVVATGPRTLFGTIASRLSVQAPQTEFERGLQRFGMLLLVAMLVMTFVVFAVNVIFGRPPIDTLLFSIALAVGLSPELLPAVVGVNLARAAQTLAGRGVLVRRLDALENLGSMDVLCTDKTGTLTEGVVRVSGAYDPQGRPNDEVLELAVINAALQSGLPNPIDNALVEAKPAPTQDVIKIAEIPYDFVRKRLSVVVRRGDRVAMITKGAVTPMLEICERTHDGRPIDRNVRADIEARQQAWAADGFRVLAVATRTVTEKPTYDIDDENGLELVGFVMLSDRPKPDASQAIAALRSLGVQVKMITGDSRYVARHVAGEVGLTNEHLLVGNDIDALTEIALVHAAARTDVFAEVDPSQKERILRALRRGGAVVGFFGDGVNDAPAMHAADVSISVESAVDVAKATADLVLTRKGLDVIQRGISEGRRTFANTLKYVLTTTSANLGNMTSMALASLVLPFLPLTAGQILLNNFLSDVPAVGIANDRVDPELVARPRRWDARFIGRFMLEFGLLSSVFDAVTFAVLLLGFGATVHEFRTGWFVESLFTELVIALVVRTRRPVWRSRPGSVLLWTTVAVAVLAFSIPYLPTSHLLGFVPLPPTLLLVIVAITCMYVAACELLKRWFFRGTAS